MKKRFNLKKLLKSIKLNESTISMVLGIIVVLIVGSLVINYFRGRNGSVPGDEENRNNSTQSLGTTHKVTAGENLWLIAEKYYDDGFKWVDIAEENKLANAANLEVGQELTIPDVSAATGNEEETAQNAIESTTYTVTRGDNLWDIAIRAYGDGYRWVDIARENKLANPDIIHSGNILLLPR